MGEKLEKGLQGATVRAWDIDYCWMCEYAEKDLMPVSGLVEQRGTAGGWSMRPDGFHLAQRGGRLGWIPNDCL